MNSDSTLLPKLRKLGSGISRLRLLQNREKQARRGGLIEFVRYFWPVLEPMTELVEGWSLEAVCLHLEAVTFGEINRLLINVPPGFMKSLLTDVLWPAWEWGPMNMPHLRYVAFSYSAGLTERDNGKFRDLLVSRQFQEMWGQRFNLRKIGEVKVTNDKTGSKLATSVGGIGTGERGDRIICDDPHNIKDGESEAIRNETVRWFRESLSNRLNDLHRSAIVIVMQRVHENDVSQVAIEMEYTHLFIPMEYDPGLYPDGYDGTEIGWIDPRTEYGELAWPERFPENEVDKIKRAVGPFAFSSQYQQTPVPRGGGILKDAWWMDWNGEEAMRYGLTWEDDSYDTDGNLVKGFKEFPPFDFCIASLDGAFGQKSENDLSALTIWGRFTDQRGNIKFMMVYAWHARLALHDLVTRVATTCKKYKVLRILVEAKANGHDVASEIQRLHAFENWGVELVNPGRLDKIARAHSVVPMLADGMVYAPLVTEWAQTTVSQCASFPKATHDDLVDSVTQALRWLRDNNLATRNDEQASILAQEAANWKRPGQRAALYPGV